MIQESKHLPRTEVNGYTQRFELGEGMPAVVIDDRIALIGRISYLHRRSYVRVLFGQGLTLEQKRQSSIATFSCNSGIRSIGLRVNREERKTFGIGEYQFTYLNRVENLLSFNIKSSKPIRITEIDPKISVRQHLVEKHGVKSHQQDSRVDKLSN